MGRVSVAPRVPGRASKDAGGKAQDRTACGSSMTRFEITPCIVGGGHDWPGASGNMDIDASEEVWAFFSQYTFILGDINSDGNVDVLDAIETVTLVLNGEYNSIVDMNYDGVVNVLDIIEIIYLILN